MDDKRLHQLLHDPEPITCRHCQRKLVDSVWAIRNHLWLTHRIRIAPSWIPYPNDFGGPALTMQNRRAVQQVRNPRGPHKGSLSYGALAIRR